MIRLARPQMEGGAEGLRARVAYLEEQLEMILEVADIVKFANARPLADDNETAYQRAVNFVEATRPVEQPDNKEEVKK